MVTKRKASPNRTNPRKVMPGDHVTKTNPRKVAAGHDPMEKKKTGRLEHKHGNVEYKTAKAKPKTNPRKMIRLPPEIIGKNIVKKTKLKTNPKGKTTKTTKLKTKPRGEVIPKLEIEKPHPRKLPVPMPPGLSKKPKNKKTTKKKK